MMNEFENKLIIKDEAYQNGLFPTIPNIRKNGSAFLLTGGCNDDILITEYTTKREIRQGRYTRLIEISTLPYMKEIRFNSYSREPSFSFDVYVRAVIQVMDPIVFYRNKNIDVDAYFDKLFSIDVKRITRKYSVLQYNGLDEELTGQLSVYNTIDPATGFSYQISAVDAEPGKDAQKYVRDAGQQEITSVLRQRAQDLAQKTTSMNYAEAVMAQVVRGEITQEQAILKIEEHEHAKFTTQLERTEKLVQNGFLTETEARPYILSNFLGSDTAQLTEAVSNEQVSNGTNEDDFAAFYPGE